MSKSFFTEGAQTAIVDAIKKAETNTSGEIRVHVEPTCKSEAETRALEVFGSLGMHQTEQKNGILFYLAYTSKKFAIIGDQGIHEKVTQDFWHELRDLLSVHFKQNQFAEGLEAAILRCGEKLQQYFPYQQEDVNELSNEISFGGEDE